MALVINKSPKMVAEIALVVTNNVCIYKEPIQALLPIILENYRIAVKWRAMNSACLNSTCYIARAFLSGSPLASLDKEVVVFLCEMSRHNRIRQFLCSIPISNAIAGLTGEPRTPTRLWHQCSTVRRQRKKPSESAGAEGSLAMRDHNSTANLRKFYFPENGSGGESRQAVSRVPRSAGQRARILFYILQLLFGLGCIPLFS